MGTGPAMEASSGSSRRRGLNRGDELLGYTGEPADENHTGLSSLHSHGSWLFCVLCILFLVYHVHNRRRFWALLDEVISLNPHASEESLRAGVSFNLDGTVRRWIA